MEVLITFVFLLTGSEEGRCWPEKKKVEKSIRKERTFLIRTVPPSRDRRGAWNKSRGGRCVTCAAITLEVRRVRVVLRKGKADTGRVKGRHRGVQGPVGSPG